MKSRMSKLSLSLLAAAGMLTAATIAPSFAQSVVKPAPYAYAENEIVVVPYGIQRYETGRRAPGSIGNEEILQMSRVVSTDGLNLRYDPDVDALRQRIEYTAREICRDLDRAAFGDSITSDRECYRDAVREAEDQVDRAVLRARTYASLK
jgi:UrcA family protein